MLEIQRTAKILNGAVALIKPKLQTGFARTLKMKIQGLESP